MSRPATRRVSKVAACLLVTCRAHRTLLVSCPLQSRHSDQQTLSPLSEIADARLQFAAPYILCPTLYTKQAGQEEGGAGRGAHGGEEHEGGNLYFAPPDLVAPRHRSYLRFHCPSFPPLSLPLWSSLPLPPASLAVLVAASVALSRTRTDIDTHEDADGQGAYLLSQTSPTPTLLPRQRLRAQALSPLAAALPSPRRTPTP